MEFTINKPSLTGGAMKHGVVVSSDIIDSKFTITIVRYLAVPLAIDIKLNMAIGFSDAMLRVHRIIELDDELFRIVATNNT